MKRSTEWVLLLRLREKEQAGMKIRYEFATGEVSEVEVSEELGSAIVDMTHRAALRDRAETRRHVSLELLLALGAQISDEQPHTDELAEKALDIAALLRAVEYLQPQQKVLIEKIYRDRQTITAVARQEGVGESAIRDRLSRIYAQLRKKLE